MGTEMKSFYRYIRPVRFSEKRMELQTLSHGGICLRFEELPEGDMFFTYSRCHPDDFFNKDVARLIAEDRAKAAKEYLDILMQLRGIPVTQNTEILVKVVALRCRQIDVSDKTPLIQRYMQQEYLGFADVLEQLDSSNRHESIRAEAWKKGISDVGWALYGNLLK